MTTPTSDTDRLLDVQEAAVMLGTFNTSGVRFPRRLISERRIRFVRIGRMVRIPESAIRELIEQNTVEPIRVVLEKESRLMTKRRFGRVRKLPSGRFQARYPGPDGIDRPVLEDLPLARRMLRGG